MEAALRQTNARSAQIYFVDRTHKEVLLYSHLTDDKDHGGEPGHKRANALVNIPIGVGAVGLVAAHGQIVFTTAHALDHASRRPADDFLEIRLEGGAVQLGASADSIVPRDIVCLPIVLTTDAQLRGEGGSHDPDTPWPNDDDHKVTAVLVVSKTRALDGGDQHEHTKEEGEVFTDLDLLFLVGICSQAGVVINGHRSLDKLKQIQTDEVQVFKEKHESLVREMMREADTVLGMTNDFADFSYRSIRSLLATGLRIRAKTRASHDEFDLAAGTDGAGPRSPNRKKKATFADDLPGGGGGGAGDGGGPGVSGGLGGGLENDLEVDADADAGDTASIERLASARARDLRHVINVAKKFTAKLLQCDL